MPGLALLLLDAINQALVIGLVALGLVVIFGLMRVINMAHGELFLLGAYTVLLTERAGGSVWLGMAVAPLAVGLIGLAIETLVIRHIYHRFLDTILATWGLSLLIKQAVILAMGPASHTVTMPLAASVTIAGEPYPAYRLLVMAIAVLAIAATFWTLLRTDIGLMARAVIANRAMAACLGIDTRRLDRLTFASGAGLAGLAGAVMAPLMSIDPQMGLGFLVPGFLSVLVGGAGQLGGALAGAAVIGGTDTIAANLAGPVIAQVTVLSLAILVIRLFPEGLLGRRWR